MLVREQRSQVGAAGGQNCSVRGELLSVAAHQRTVAQLPFSSQTLEYLER